MGLPLEKFGYYGGEWTAAPGGFEQGGVLGCKGGQMEGYCSHGLESGAP